MIQHLFTLLDLVRGFFGRPFQRATFSAEDSGRSVPIASDEENALAVEMPNIIYGTAWKEHQTGQMVYQAICAGYRGFDTAGEPQCYREDLVGEGIRRAISEGMISRGEIFIQTKFSPSILQDPQRMPFNARDPIEKQVKDSISVSLNHFNFGNAADSYLDSVLLHSYLPTGSETLAAWQALQAFVPHKIRRLGVSNVDLTQLEVLHRLSTIKPQVVQNRFYLETDYDVELRKFCTEKGMQYQAYSISRRSKHLLDAKPVVRLAEHVGVSRQTALFFLIQQLGNIAVLDGKTREVQMEETIQDMKKIGNYIIASRNELLIEEVRQEFCSLLKEEKRVKHDS